MKKNPIIGDPSHEFIHTLKKFRTDPAWRAMRQKVKSERSTYAYLPKSKAHTFSSPLECIRDDSGDVRKAYEPSNIMHIIEGRIIPDEEILTHIGFDYAMDEQERKKFLSKGLAYKKHCEDKLKDGSKTDQDTSTKKNPTYAKTTTHHTAIAETLDKIAHRRIRTSGGGSIEFRLEKPKEEVSPNQRITPDFIIKKHGVNMQLSTFLKSRTPTQPTEAHLAMIDKLLDILQATDAERAEVAQAIQQDSSERPTGVKVAPRPTKRNRS